MIQTKGTVEDIIYRNSDNMYTVFVIDTEDGLITVVGKVLDINVGDIFSVSGNLVYHNEYGEQIKLNTYEKFMPSSISEIERYLSSGIISNIGPKRARELVEKFGEDTLEIMTNNPERLLDIQGIGKKTLEKIHDSILLAYESRNTTMYLQKFNLGIKLTTEIYSKYKNKTKEIIETNPYQLIDDIKGIGFTTADKIALNNGIKPDSEFRIRAGLIYVLVSDEVRDGNCFMYYDEFILETSRVLNIEKELIEEQIPYLAFLGRINIEIIEGDKLVYLSTVYEIENTIVRKLLNLLDKEKAFNGFDLDKEIELIQRFEQIEYSVTQISAIKTALEEKLAIITGGPGTGKTTIIKAIISIAKNIGINYLLCAPTGRAAKRMEESTGNEASTIHRMLGYKSLSDEFTLNYHEENPLKADLIIVDEVSMVDIYLMNNLLKAISSDAMAIFVGDSDQLPSVGPGNILNDMINSGVIPTIKLDTIFRQGEGSNIIKNAHLINSGKNPVLNEENKDFFFVKTRNDGETLNTIVDLVSNRLPKHYNVNPLEDIQILTPTRRGICGVDSINKRLQEVLNAPDFNKIEVKIGDMVFREKDKVMQIKNNYDIELKDQNLNTLSGVFNGDIGYIKNIFSEIRNLEINYDGKLAKYNYSDLPELTLSYCATIHKSQGSEFPIVIIPMASAPYMLLTRNILYTGITRAKSLVVLVGNEEILRRMIQNNNTKKRNSTLDYRLKKVHDLRRMNDWFLIFLK